MTSDLPQETTPENSDAPHRRLFTKELLARTVSAAVLAVGALYLTWHSFPAFLALAIVIMLLMVWEWGRLTNNDTPLQLAIPAITTLIAIAAFLTGEWPLLLASLTAGAFLAAWATHYWWRSKWALLGLAYVALPVMSLLYLRHNPSLGFEAVLFVFLIVWAADTAAYFSGRHFGGKKLAPAISPKKTWSGAIGGLFAGLITGALFAISINSEPVILALIGIFLAAVSQCGDLAESAIKRHFGVKDTSKLIPGHGGILDRLDGVITASIGAAIIAVLHNHASPAEALLIWSP